MGLNFNIALETVEKLKEKKENLLYTFQVSFSHTVYRP